MRTAIDTIKGKLCTLIIHDDTVFADFNKMLKLEATHGFEIYHEGKNFATALFALPHAPKRDDMKLIARYEAEGISIISSYGIYMSELDECGYDKDAGRVRITYAEDEQGNKIEVAIL